MTKEINSELQPIPNHQLVHGAIYKLKGSSGTGTVEVRCNICSEGSEIWFTDVMGKEQCGHVFEYLRAEDGEFANNDQ
ncbi:hypothetical protein [Vibrio parahaemolyticus]|jgi:hypothetical protein|uniref:hypothetical protein n=1 Tax=Vibrio parahaemolyticus TaxID=670 RepID=UPI0024BC3A8A|nr:hypothetical protein [Vibrio parahaemolyticus]MEA5230326.1 hypothetical protein [Vibrio parahaemolyticus]WHT06197.1 hypothetical protein O2T11_25090 [Vibrio parahaemolyticus]